MYIFILILEPSESFSNLLVEIKIVFWRETQGHTWSVNNINNLEQYALKL